MLKKDWKKNLLRVKQSADQYLGRAEKSEVLSEDLQNLERRVDLIKTVCQTTHKKMQSCLSSMGPGQEYDKRYRKLPETQLSQSMKENGTLLNTETLLGEMFDKCGDVESQIAIEFLEMEGAMEKDVLNPLHSIIEHEIPSIQRLRRQLNKLTLDMDAAKAKYNTAIRQTNSNMTPAKVDQMREEMEDAQHKVESCRDSLATEMYTFVSREADYGQLLYQFVLAQEKYHREALTSLQAIIPQMQERMAKSVHMPVYGSSLEDHVARTGRDIAVVLEDCIAVLAELGLEEEGILRIAGSSSKVKKLKAAFDSGYVDMEEYISDIHCIAGALKLYLRELPEPLLTYELYDDFMQVVHLPQDQKLQQLWKLLGKLPQSHYNNLMYLIKFLAKVAEYQHINKMSSTNIAIVIGPNLLWPYGNEGPSVLSTSTQSAIVEMLVTQADWFFPNTVDFHPKGSSPSDRRRSSSANLLQSTQSTPATKSKKSHKNRKNSALNTAMSMAHHTLMAPVAKGPESDGISGTNGNKAGNHVTNNNNSHDASKTPGEEGDTDDSGKKSLPKAKTPVGYGSLPGPKYPRKSMLSSMNSLRKRQWSEERELSSNEEDISDTVSESGLKLCNRAPPSDSFRKSMSPPIKPPPPKSVHSDVYSTVFALQALGNNSSATDYLNRVRTLWDGHMCAPTHSKRTSFGDGKLAKPVHFRSASLTGGSSLLSESEKSEEKSSGQASASLNSLESAEVEVQSATKTHDLADIRRASLAKVIEVDSPGASPRPPGYVKRKSFSTSDVSSPGLREVSLKPATDALPTEESSIDSGHPTSSASRSGQQSPQSSITAITNGTVNSSKESTPENTAKLTESSIDSLPVLSSIEDATGIRFIDSSRESSQFSDRDFTTSGSEHSRLSTENDVTNHTESPGNSTDAIVDAVTSLSCNPPKGCSTEIDFTSQVVQPANDQVNTHHQYNNQISDEVLPTVITEPAPSVQHCQPSPPLSVTGSTGRLDVHQSPDSGGYASAGSSPKPTRRNKKPAPLPPRPVERPAGPAPPPPAEKPPPPTEKPLISIPSTADLPEQISPSVQSSKQPSFHDRPEKPERPSERPHLEKPVTDVKTDRPSSPTQQRPERPRGPPPGVPEKPTVAAKPDVGNMPQRSASMRPPRPDFPPPPPGHKRSNSQEGVIDQPPPSPVDSTHL